MQAVGPCCLAQLIDDNTWLDAGDSSLGIDRQDVSHMPREVQDDRMVDALPGEARARSSGEDGHPSSVCDSDDVLDIAGIAREDNGDGFHLVDRGIRRIQQTGRAVDEHIGRAA